MALRSNMGVNVAPAQSQPNASAASPAAEATAETPISDNHPVLEGVAEEVTDDNAEAGTGEAEQSELATQKPRQSDEQNAVFAEERRKEQIERLRLEKAETERKLRERDDWIASKFGAQGINTWEQYQAVMEHTLQQQATAEVEKARNEFREATGLDPAIMESVVANHPLVKQMRSELATYRQERTGGMVQKQVDELMQEYPHIKSSADIDQPTLTKWRSSNGNLTLTEAYAAVHRKELSTQAKASGEKEAIGKIASKNHLNTEKSGGAEPAGGEVEITAEMRRAYADFGVTDLKRIRQIERNKRKGG